MSRYKGDSLLSLLDKLLNNIKINAVTDCWEWQLSKNNIGYGLIRDGKKMRTVHRASYEEHTNTKIPPGICVCHTCDNPLCINPQHLWLGTRKQNTKDMIDKNRHSIFGSVNGKQPKTTCPHCYRSIPNNMFSRYHGNKCKMKPSINTV